MGRGYITESLEGLLSLLRYRSPADCDVASNDEFFPGASYLYVLYGMGFKSDFRQMMQTFVDPSVARYHLQQKQKVTQQALKNLPQHRDLICLL